MTVRFGIDVFLEQVAVYRHHRLAFLTNQAATTASYTPSRQALYQAGFPLIKLLSPEHGLEAVGEDGRPMRDGMDGLTGLPVISLYGDKLQPSEEDLADVDTVLVDLPDIGCRFYTYLWTLTHVMEACALHQKKLILLDRPNPLSGRMDLAEGPMLDEGKCASFIGRWSIPLRHSCTMGELARFWQQERLPALALTVVRAEGWQRHQFVADWQPSFIPTSPAMVSAEAALLYPGLGLLEATNLSEGRGTATPFRITGAPWLDAHQLVALFNGQDVPGTVARAITFTPQSGNYTGLLCQGVMVHVVDKSRFRPVLTGLLIIRLVRDQYPDQFRWAPYPTHVNPTGSRHLDKLLGMPNAEGLFDLPLPAFVKSLHMLLRCETWKELMKSYLLY
ncbi:exo-beta-N-acetylmuramidase NamZ family protein [Spirosoma pulveris]